MSSRLRILALALPLALLAIMIGRAEWHLAHSETWLFKMAGYDPRDLLRGHYLRFRLEIEPTGEATACDRNDASCCYCLSPGRGIEGAGFEAELETMTCEAARQECAAFVQGAALRALNRFYIPEARRVELETILQIAAVADRAHLAVAVNEAGEPVIERVLVDGMSIELAEPMSREVTEAASELEPPPLEE